MHSGGLLVNQILGILQNYIALLGPIMLLRISLVNTRHVQTAGERLLYKGREKEIGERNKWRTGSYRSK
jgi:gamma-glutamyltranspeptidase